MREQVISIRVDLNVKLREWVAQAVKIRLWNTRYHSSSTECQTQNYLVQKYFESRTMTLVIPLP